MNSFILTVRFKRQDWKHQSHSETSHWCRSWCGNPGHIDIWEHGERSEEVGAVVEEADRE